MRAKLDPRKSFIIKVAIGAGALLILWGVSETEFRERARELDLSNEHLAQKIEEDKSELGSESVNMKKNRILRDEFLPALKAQLEFPDTLEPAPKEIDPAVHLKQILSESQKGLKDDAARKSVIIPEQEWNIANRIKKENTSWEISELRLRLCATRKILATCVDGGVARVLSISQGQAILNEIENSHYSIARFPITIKMESDLRGLTNLILTFQKRGNFLEVRSLSVKSKSENEPLLSSEIEFAAIRLDEGVRLAKDMETKTQPGTGEKTPARVPRRNY